MIDRHRRQRGEHRQAVIFYDVKRGLEQEMICQPKCAELHDRDREIAHAKYVLRKDGKPGEERRMLELVAPFEALCEYELFGEVATRAREEERLLN